MSQITKKLIMSKLKEVLDPEINISIVDLGLIYDVKISKKPDLIIITMTLTTAGCPLYDLIKQDIIDKIKEFGFKEKDITINLVFDPPWTIEKMSKKGRVMFGI